MTALSHQPPAVRRSRWVGTNTLKSGEAGESPEGGDRPDGELAAAIDEHFGSFEAFGKQLSTATASVQGSGWGVLAWEPTSRRLVVEQVWSLVNWTDVTRRFDEARGR